MRYELFDGMTAVGRMERRPGGRVRLEVDEAYLFLVLDHLLASGVLRGSAHGAPRLRAVAPDAAAFDRSCSSLPEATGLVAVPRPTGRAAGVPPARPHLEIV